jgi:hypothetical protein
MCPILDSRDGFPKLEQLGRLHTFHAAVETIVLRIGETGFWSAAQ